MGLMIAAEYPNYNIIEVLPEKCISIGFNPLSSKDVREIGAWQIPVFIGGDSGIMHLASASKVSTVGLFPR
jgi:ADP-heptose:LPS heptosyltransferase